MIAACFCTDAYLLVLTPGFEDIEMNRVSWDVTLEGTTKLHLAWNDARLAVVFELAWIATSSKVVRKRTNNFYGVGSDGGICVE